MGGKYYKGDFYDILTESKTETIIVNNIFDNEINNKLDCPDINNIKKFDKNFIQPLIQTQIKNIEEEYANLNKKIDSISFHMGIEKKEEKDMRFPSQEEFNKISKYFLEKDEKSFKVLMKSLFNS